jgi:hypothetical protein
MLGISKDGPQLSGRTSGGPAQIVDNSPLPPP